MEEETGKRKRKEERITRKEDRREKAYIHRHIARYKRSTERKPSANTLTHMHNVFGNNKKAKTNVTLQPYEYQVLFGNQIPQMRVCRL